jgi:hypothetical protein
MGKWGVVTALAGAIALAACAVLLSSTGRSTQLLQEQLAVSPAVQKQLDVVSKKLNGERPPHGVSK